MSVTTWHPPPITHLGYSSHTSNSDYGRWTHLPSAHYSPVTLTTPSTLSPRIHRKYDTYDSSASTSGGTAVDLFSLGRANHGYSRPGTSGGSNVTSIALSDKTSVPFESEPRKSSSSLLPGSHRNDTKNIIYTYTDPSPPAHSRLSSSSGYRPELYSTSESSVPSYKTNYTTASVKSTSSPWSSSSGGSKAGLETGSSSSSWRPVKSPSAASAIAHSSGNNFVTEPSTTRGYELYTDTFNKPATTTSHISYSNPTTGKNHSLHRSHSFHGSPSSSTSASNYDTAILHYNPVTSRTVQDKLESWGNDRQNANSLNPYTIRDSHTSTAKEPAYSYSSNLQNHSHHHDYNNNNSSSATYGSQHKTISIPEVAENGSIRTSSFHLSGSTKPHTYESYNHGLGLSRPTSSITNGYGELEKSTANLQLKLDELHLGGTTTNNGTNSSTLASKLRTPDSSKSLLVPLSPRTSRRSNDIDRYAYLNGERSATAPSSSETVGMLHTGDVSISRTTSSHQQRFRQTQARQPKSILKKKSAYDTVSGTENWRSYIRDSEWLDSSGGMYKQNTMPNLRQSSSSRAPLPQLARKHSNSTGRRVHFAI